jgi:cellulose synthase/poly-beta-1,6-N-acetylglucosamine synthase-like glycosyltransferase
MTSLAGLDLPPYIEVLVVPNVGPKGKPRACNYGLRFARGSYVVLYDAEDRPERDQLKKALVAFARHDIACVQAKLNFYNRDQNLLTKWFTSEYSTWFDLYLPALSRLRLPIPLGGTSNHFPIRFLRAVGAWDPYNVTEDADLGMRLARRQLRTAVIDSVTYEEANSHLGNWLRQRSRWLKGYIQTWLVHMRHPLELHSELGPVGFLAFQAMVFGTFFTCLVNPVLWFLVLAWYTTHAGIIQALYPGPILYVSAVAFFGGNFLFVFVSVLGSLQRGFYHGVKYALASHVYWALMSVATFKALHQLMVKPYYWEKTRHGLDTLSAVPGLSGRP